MRRLIPSVVAGYLIISLVTVVSFVVLNKTRADLNQPGWLRVKLAISLLGAVLGGYATARFAGIERKRAVLWLAGLMTVLSAAAVVVKFGSEPLWFQAALVLGAGPAVWIGSFGSAGSSRSKTN